MYFHNSTLITFLFVYLYTLYLMIKYRRQSKNRFHLIAILSNSKDANTIKCFLEERGCFKDYSGAIKHLDQLWGKREIKPEEYEIISEYYNKMHERKKYISELGNYYDPEEVRTVLTLERAWQAQLKR